MRINPPTDKLGHFIANFRRRYAVEDFVKIRKRLCDFMTTLQAKVLTPICGNCYLDKVNFLELPIEPPHICTDTWRNDLAWEVGLTEKEIRNIARKLREDEDVQLRCEKCSTLLQYSQDDFYVDSEFFEEYFDIPESRQRRPSRQLKKEIARLYGHKCYGCGKKLLKEDITNDHIVARVHGGVISPLNLQVLCKNCNNSIKGSMKVDTVNVHLTFLFRPPPSDSYEGVTW